MSVRRRSRLLAVALIVLTFVGTSGAWHGTDDDDVRGLAIAHNHSAHHQQLRAPASRTTTEHCALCHWLQTFRADSARVLRAHTMAASPRARRLAAVQPLRSPFRLDLPSRAPPV